MSDNRTMQQVDRDAWQAGYGVSSSVANSNHNSLELQAMYEALAQRTALRAAAEEAKNFQTDNKDN